jgi:4-hydroxy-tetrahydrodipicolinate reductase
VISVPPRIALLGMGKMGREVDGLAKERGIEVVARLDVAEVRDRSAAKAALGRAQVAVEFTTPDTVVSNIELCLEAGVPVVVGTTGWYQQLDGVRARVEKTGGSLLFSPNFSTGVALLKALCTRAGELLQALDGFDVHISETHHAQKKDAPSGTALLLRDALGEAGRGVQITSVRTGNVPGHHEVAIDSAYDSVVLSHDARSRRVFADGALRAALWLRGRKGVFTMDDVVALGAP